MKEEDRDANPCLTCGACCAALRVAFHWSEASDASEDGVPVELTAPLRTHERAMLGTDSDRPRCIALAGDVGVATQCTVYARRPSPCRALRWHGQDGIESPQCTRARARHGLPELEIHANANRGR